MDDDDFIQVNGKTIGERMDERMLRNLKEDTPFRREVLKLINAELRK